MGLSLAGNNDLIQMARRRNPFEGMGTEADTCEMVPNELIGLCANHEGVRVGER